MHPLRQIFPVKALLLVTAFREAFHCASWNRRHLGHITYDAAGFCQILDKKVNHLGGFLNVKIGSLPPTQVAMHHGSALETWRNLLKARWTNLTTRLR